MLLRAEGGNGGLEVANDAQERLHNRSWDDMRIGKGPIVS